MCKPRPYSKTWYAGALKMSESRLADCAYAYGLWRKMYTESKRVDKAGSFRRELKKALFKKALGELAEQSSLHDKLIRGATG